MEKAKQCVFCGKRSKVKVNQSFQVCEECADKLTAMSLSLGIPVIMAQGGVPKAVMVPRPLSQN